ncbi:MAG TPA: TIGR00645 family protein [Xanthobacteraceae bacterium]|nr:TIGR00645 family protein [Xanthobacteraceae bacterium]
MTEPRQVPFLERWLEWLIFQSRWVMAPFYLGLIAALFVLLFKFVQELIHFIAITVSATEADIILGVLALIDLSLTANLVLIVIFSGYENFVSKIDPEGHPDWPEWMTQIDFSGLKQKLFASIVAISAVQVLKAFMKLGNVSDGAAGAATDRYLFWLVGIHVVFVLSGLVLAWSDKIGDHPKKKGGH